MDKEYDSPRIPLQSQSQFSNGDENYLSAVKWLYSGRINRKSFLIGIIANEIIYSIGFMLFGLWKDPRVDTIYFPIFYSVIFITYIMLLIRRLHDTNHSGMWTVFILLPRILAHIPFMYALLSIPRSIISFVFVVYLLYKKGTNGVNDYGESPRNFF